MNMISFGIRFFGKVLTEDPRELSVLWRIYYFDSGHDGLDEGDYLDLAP